MKKLCYLFFIAAFGFLTNAATNNDSTREEGRYYEESGGYSIIPPESWQVFEMPGLKYKVFIESTIGNSKANINFADEAFDGDLNFYVDAVIMQLKNLLGENIEITERSDFVTLKNLKGIKLITNTFQFGIHARQILYCFPGNGKKLLAGCTVLAEAGESYDELFDKTMKTFEWTE